MLTIGEREVLLRGTGLQELRRRATLEGVLCAFLTYMLRDRIVLLNKLVYGHEATSHSQDQVVILDLHDHLIGEIAVAPLCFPNEQTLYSLF